ncbi:hypothetical protein [Hyphomicrobium sp.]|jgi:hypothetical protein
MVHFAGWREFGSFAFEALVAAAKDGTLEKKEDQIWRQGMLKWETALTW